MYKRKPPRLTEHQMMECQRWGIYTAKCFPKPPPGPPPRKTKHNRQRVQNTIIAKDPKLRRPADEVKPSLQRPKVEAEKKCPALRQKRHEHKKEATKKEKEEVVTKEEAVTTESQPLLRDLPRPEWARKTGKRDLDGALDWDWTAKPESEMTKGEREMFLEIQRDLHKVMKDSGDVRDHWQHVPGRCAPRPRDALVAPRCPSRCSVCRQTLGPKDWPNPQWGMMRHAEQLTHVQVGVVCRSCQWSPHQTLPRKTAQKEKEKMSEQPRARKQPPRLLEQNEGDEATKRRKKDGGSTVVLRSRSRARVRRRTCQPRLNSFHRVG